ncbi:GGDEF domain-containing protein [Quadrisphaera setariae]|uniref:GGDEF domain-containing protein n=1 Tax=Quadrisphaera setariae TaxID=2593304 RepID=A0A5C8ZK89_9ACTN|nr:GGDEF domain-containing protein [Quadrisphaera setariae]TXR58034.1 GGDEF domain-containing protein [Quadrisphaera setariae]
MLVVIPALVVLQVRGAAHGWPWGVQLVVWAVFSASRDDAVQRVLGGGSLERRVVARTVLGCLLGALAVFSSGAPELAPVVCTLVTAVHLRWAARWSLPAGLAGICLSVPAGVVLDHLGGVHPMAGPYSLWISVALMGLGAATVGNLALLSAQQEEAQQRAARAQQLREELLRRAAEHDVLTGLLSRSAVTARLAAGAARARPGCATGVLFCDLDGFKAVNDGHGHAAGDALLVEVAARLVEAVGASGEVGRVGGDEFVVVLQGLERPAEAHDVAERVRSAVDAPVAVGDRLVATGVSVGVAVTTGRTSADDLLDAADAAMYADKAERRRARTAAGAATSAEVPTGT